MIKTYHIYLNGLFIGTKALSINEVKKYERAGYILKTTSQWISDNVDYE